MTTPQGPQPPQSNRPGAPGPGRPGAMTMAMQAVQARPTGPKVLRIGVIQGDKMVEERIIRSRETVTVGTSEKNHFVVANASLPPTFELFQLVGGDYILNFTTDMRGRVGLAGGVQALDQLRSTGAARNAGNYWQVKLADSSRGRVAIGDTTLLFQFIDPPPVQPRPQLPAAVVGGFVAGIDWLFTAFIMFSFMTHFGFIIFLENADWPVPPTLATIPDDLSDIIFAEPEEPPPPEETPTDQTTDEPVEEVAQEEPTHDTQETPAETPAEQQQAHDQDARMVAEAAAAQVDQLLLGALGSDGALHDVLAGGAVTGSAADVLAQAQGVGVASSSTGGTLRDRSGGGTVGGSGALSGLRAAGAAGALDEGGAVHEAAPRGRFRPVAAADDEQGSGDFDASVVVRMINTRRSAIQACYERELRASPTLSGRISVGLTIQESGSVSGVHVTDNTMSGGDAVGACVVRVIQGFRFNPGPTGGSVIYTFPFVFEPQT